MSTERLQVRVEGFDDHLVIVFPRKMDSYITPWQDAMQFALTLELAARETPVQNCIINPVELAAETGQIKLNKHNDKYVVLNFAWTDRIKLTPQAARYVADAIKIVADDLRLLTRGVRMRYDIEGRKGRPTPEWSHERKSFPVR